MDLQALKRKYSWQAIPEWELAKLQSEAPPEVEAQKPRRGRPPKQVESTDGNGD